MSDYYFYTYDFTQIPPEKGLFDEKYNTPDDALNHRLQDRLLPVAHKRTNGTADKYSNRLYYHDGVGLMRLQANKELPYYKKDFSKDVVDSYPYLDIIIDNREGHHVIGIEKNGAFKKSDGDANSTLRVARLLAESINDCLRPYGWTIGIKAIARPVDLWSLTINRVRHHNARVRSIEFLFPTDDEAGGVQQSNALRLLTGLSRKNGAADAAFRMNYKNGDEAELMRAEEDFKAIEIFASRQHYEINVRFNDDMGVVRSGTLLYAHYEVPAPHVANFIAGAPGFGKEGDGEFGLCTFMDDTAMKLREFENG